MTGNEYIKSKRKEKGITLQTLSKKSGVSCGYLSRVEHGEYEVTFKNLLRILDGLDTSIYDFLNVIGYFPPSYKKENGMNTKSLINGAEPPTMYLTATRYERPMNSDENGISGVNESKRGGRGSNPRL
ncbi:MAG: helix-turn-helix transcriptional regulator [Nitrospirae bacterium]|nr:helix-turn-helix transcriptional regulator [Nitrospirota bacterium]